MKYISTYESFSVNETMDMFTLPVDPIPGIKDVISDIGEWFTQTGEFLWNKLTSFIDWLKSKISIPGIKEYFSQLFEAIGELSKIQLNRVTNLFFDKEYTKVEWSDLNVGTVKNLYQKITTSIKEFTTDKSWSFSDDKDKLKSEEGVDDKSLKLKYWINTTLAFLGKSVLSAVIHAILSTILIALGLSAGPIVATIASVVILILFIWSSKKKVNLDIKVMKDVRDVPGYKPQSIIGKITGWSDFAKQKVEDYQDFTQGESQFQKLYFQRLKEQKEKIKSEELNFS
jgi:hypothetical protein